MSVPQEILDRHASGEREIRVSPETYADYCDGLMSLYRHSPREIRTGDEQWVWYKGARVIRGMVQ